MSWRNDYGWLIVLYADEQRRHYRKLKAGTTWREAHDAMRQALKEDPAFVKAWLIRKESE